MKHIGDNSGGMMAGMPMFIMKGGGDHHLKRRNDMLVLII